VMAYMIFKQIMKAIIIGVSFAAIPVVLYLLGFEIPLSIQTVVWFALLGIAIYFVYDVISGWMKMMRIITWPIRRLFRKGQKEKAAHLKEEKPKEKKEKPKEEKKEEKEPEDKSKAEGTNEDYEEIK
jgi:hypothetical protein